MDFKSPFLAAETASPPASKKGALNQVPIAADGLDWWAGLVYRE